MLVKLLHQDLMKPLKNKTYSLKCVNLCITKRNSREKEAKVASLVLLSTQDLMILLLSQYHDEAIKTSNIFLILRNEYYI